ncbi:hypothetical protein G6F60_015762 [Rhizopus arrhizus]|nr:hypothetical protein G6F60_015762 [Rhizopus arrhizus]
MPCHVDHIVGATKDEGVAIVITDGPVQRAVQQFLEVAEPGGNGGVTTSTPFCPAATSSPVFSSLTFMR